ncbi:MAG TPA: membrane protein insertase YidC [Frankiaceae bacterium]|nr:membrane protein insertase YidC [Frankiaceae bacterium]
MLDPLYRLVARGIVVFSDGLAPVFGQNSFMSYALAIVLIVMLVRLAIVPLFVRSVKAQRTMQMLQPHIKEIREKYKNDRQQMNAKIMELQKEHGNPLLGCLPLVLQIPLFISLFHVFRAIAPSSNGHGGYYFKAAAGLSVNEVQNIATAKLAGVSLAAAFTNSAKELAFLSANGVAVKITCVVLIIIMSTTTFITQKQIMARNGPADPQQQMIQKVLLYASPLFLAVFGFNFPIAVLLYWFTTNIWSMGQQHFIIKRMPPLQINKSGSAAPAAPTTSGGGLTSLLKGKSATPAPEPAAPQRLAQVRQPPAESADGKSKDNGAANGSEAAASGSSAPGGGGRNVKPGKATSRPSNRPVNKKRTGKGGSRRGGRH